MNLISSGPALVFFIVGSLAIASAILVVALRNPVHSALFLLLTFVAVAILFFLLGAEFLGAVQMLVYAGGIMVLFLFVVMLINVRRVTAEPSFSAWWKGALMTGVALMIVLSAILRSGSFAPVVDNPAGLGREKMETVRLIRKDNGKVVRRRTIEVESRNSEAIGMRLYRDYLVPFEIASVFLLVAMIGAIVIGKRELHAMEEECTPQFILDRVAEEKRIKRLHDA